MTGATDLAKMVPGFEFLQTLMKGAGAALPGLPGMAAVPGMSQWIAPTLDPEEIEKRINELKTVQFWLEQNARLLNTTIQALEVQRMTLSTLKTMNLPMADLREALKVRPPAAAAPAPAPAPAPTPAPAPEPEPERAAAAPAIDPMQWWGALTQQFTEIATKAVKDSAADAAKSLAGAAVKQGVAAAGKTLKKAAAAPGQAARAASAARKSATPAKTNRTAK
jgi:pyruvate/2-oxoglutarate dehydrogenase complex dihydrolipoamide acyltransferase (E2) component